MKFLFFILIITVSCSENAYVLNSAKFKNSISLKTVSFKNEYQSYKLLVSRRKLDKLRLIPYNEINNYVLHYKNLLIEIFDEIKKGNYYILYGIYKDGVIGIEQYDSFHQKFVRNISEKSILFNNNKTTKFNNYDKEKALKYCRSGDLLMCEKLFSSLNHDLDKKKKDYEIFQEIESILVNYNDSTYFLAEIYSIYDESFLNQKYLRLYRLSFFHYIYQDPGKALQLISNKHKILKELLLSKYFSWIYFYLYEEYGGFGLQKKYGLFYNLNEGKNINKILNMTVLPNNYFIENRKAYADVKNCIATKLYVSLTSIIEKYLIDYYLYEKHDIKPEILNSIKNICKTSEGEKDFQCMPNILSSHKKYKCHSNTTKVPWLKPQLEINPSWVWDNWQTPGGI